MVAQGDEKSESLIPLSSGRRNQRRLPFQSCDLCFEEGIRLSYDVWLRRAFSAEITGSKVCGQKFQAC